MCLHHKTSRLVGVTARLVGSVSFVFDKSGRHHFAPCQLNVKPLADIDHHVVAVCAQPPPDLDGCFLYITWRNSFEKAALHSNHVQIGRLVCNNNPNLIELNNLACIAN